MSRFAVYHWIKTGAIKPTAEIEDLQLADERPRADSWPPFIRRFLWIMGSLALVVALLFFMAYNWQAMGPMFKFALLQGSLIVTLIFYALWSSLLVPRYQLSSHTLVLGQTLIRVVVAMLVGGLLALFGQVYQTGADPWQLFALWSLLISVMVVSSGQAVLWIMWSVLINVALVLYVDTRPAWLMLLGPIEQAIWLFLIVNGLLWLIVMGLDGEQPVAPRVLKRFRVVQPWAGQLQATALLFCFTYMGMAAIIDWHNQGAGFAVASVLGLAGFFVIYRLIRQDLSLLALWSMSLMLLIITLVMKITDGWASGYTLFWLSMMIIAMTTLAVKWLKSLRSQSIKPSDSED